MRCLKLRNNGPVAPDSRPARLARKDSRAIRFAAIVGVCLFAVGCRQDMQDQPKYKPLAATDFFGDGRSERPLIADTVARGHLTLDEARYTGKVNGNDVTEFPFPITRADLERGQQRFNIFCSPCHSRIGNGEGMIVRRGFRMAASYYTDRLKKAPVGHFFDVITNGFGAMPSYASRVPVDDRWRIIAYIRTLQFSENAKVSDVPADKRTELNSSPQPGANLLNAQQAPSAAATPAPARKGTSK
jgi:mono/diheme cytochrome c family protein